MIQSKDNPLYKKLIAVRSASYARKSQLIAVEGLRHLLDVLKSGFLPEFIFISDDSRGQEAYRLIQDSLEATGAPLEDHRFIGLSASLFDRASAQKTPQGVMALVPFKMVQLGTFLGSLEKEGKVCRLLILEDIQDPGNVGTLIRTADAFSFDGVFLTDSCAAAWNPKTVAASMGSLFHLALLEAKGGVREAAGLLEQAGFEIVASGLKGEDVSCAAGFKPRLALMLGNEGSGLSALALESAGRVLRIPMRGAAESLNVASAGAILLWEMSGRGSTARPGLV